MLDNVIELQLHNCCYAGEIFILAIIPSYIHSYIANQYDRYSIFTSFSTWPGDFRIILLNSKLSINLWS